MVWSEMQVKEVSYSCAEVKLNTQNQFLAQDGVGLAKLS